MKRILLFILCLSLQGIARGQTLRYWFDNNNSPDGSLAISSGERIQANFDVSSLSFGVHSINIMLENKDGVQGSTISRAFIKSITAENIMSYRCWFDNDETTAQTAEIKSGNILLDVSGLTDGLHTVTVQAYGNGMTAPMSYLFLKVPNLSGTETLTYICLIDNVMYEQQIVYTNQSTIHIDLDVAPLKQGLHQLQVMLATESGAVTSAYTAYFYRMVLQKEVDDTRILYNLDGIAQNTLSATASSDGQMHFDLDVSSLSTGLHCLNYALLDGNGLYATSSTYWFYKVPNGGEGIISYEYWLNDNESELVKKVLDEPVNTYNLISLLPVKALPIRSSKFKFAYQNDTLPVVYAKNDFHVRFMEVGGSFAFAEASYIDERVCDTVVADALNETNIMNRPKKDEIHWYSFYAKTGDSIALKTSTACTIQVFSPTGEEVYTANAKGSLSWDGTHTMDNGVYYVAIHDITSTNVSSVTLYAQHIDRYAVLRQDVSVMGNAGLNTIEFFGNGFDSLNSIDFVHATDTIRAYCIEHINNSNIYAILNCLDAPIGVYDALFYFGKENAIIKKKAAITIENATEITITTHLDYPSSFLFGDDVKYTYTITNNGNMTIYNLPITITLMSEDGVIGDTWLEGIDVPTILEAIDEAYKADSIELSLEQKEIIDQELDNASQNHLFYTITYQYLGTDSKNTAIRTKNARGTLCIPPFTTRTISIRQKAETNSQIQISTAPNNEILPPTILRNNQNKPQTSKSVGTNKTYHSIKQMQDDSNHYIDYDIPSAAHKSRPSWFCCHYEQVGNVLDLVSNIPGLIGCTSGLLSVLTGEVAAARCENAESLTLTDRFWSWGGAALGCLPVPDLVSRVWSLSSTVHSMASSPSVGRIANIPPECGDTNEGVCTLVASSDPNDIIGYTSESGSRYMRQDVKTIHYEIEYENDTALATAPAHTIIVRDTLDAIRFDLASFAATEIKIGDRKMKWETPQGGTQTLDMRTRMNVIAQVKLDYSEQTGIAQWTITSLDPMTMEPIADADLGVLPVNFDGNGMGTISYRINLKNRFDDGTQIINRASIIFDKNEPILTPVWTNEVDAVKPVSKVVKTDLVSDSLTLYLSTSDNRSGVWMRDIYARVSIKDEWQVAAQSVSDTIVVPLTNGWRQFYVLAVDSAGNVESKMPNAEFSMVLDTYLITFYDEDGITILDAREWDYGVVPLCETPHKASDNMYRYEFDQWIPSLSPVIEEASYTATYKSIPLVATSIEKIKLIPSVRKIVRNGHIFIIREDRCYTIIGQVVD